MSIFFFLIIGLVLGFIIGMFYGRLLTLRDRRRRNIVADCEHCVRVRLARTLQTC